MSATKVSINHLKMTRWLLTDNESATRVEGFRGRERFRRWKEEKLWLSREIASVTLDFHYQSDKWQALANSQHACFNPGFKAYCMSQRDIWWSLREDAFNRSKPILQVSMLCIATMTLVNISDPMI